MLSFEIQVGKLLIHLGLKTQRELAAIAGIDPSDVSRIKTSSRPPSAFTCLLFAGLTASPEDRTFWLEASGITEKQRGLLENALSLDAPFAKRPHKHAALVAQLIDVMEDKKDPEQGPSIRRVIQTAHQVVFPERYENLLDRRKKV